MTKSPPLGQAQKVLSSAQRHGRGLKEVNDKLTDLVASLRDQKRRLSEFSQTRAVPTPDGKGEVPLVSDASERALVTELALAREALEVSRREEERIRERLAEIESENRRLCDEYVAVQEQNSELVNLYAAVERLHGAPDRAEVLSAIQEIVVNMIGSEEMVLFELGADGSQLVPTHVLGVAPEAAQEIAIGAGPIGCAAAEGRTQLAAQDGSSAAPAIHLTACIPLKLAGKVTGALAIYRLLGHKPALTEFDHELFAVLERHAAPALHASAFQKRVSGAR